jgi:hypothetical protein
MKIKRACIIVHIIFLNNVTQPKVNTEMLNTVVVFYILTEQAYKTLMIVKNWDCFKKTQMYAC